MDKATFILILISIIFLYVLGINYIKAKYGDKNKKDNK